MIGIVSVLYKSDAVLPDFFESLARQTYQDFLLILVDNDANETTQSIIRNLNIQYSNIKINYIDSKANIGVAAGNNLGIQKAIHFKCRQILLSNNDIVLVENDILDKMIYLNLSENKKLITPKILYYDTKKVWMAGGYFSKWRSLGVHYGNHAEADDSRFNFSREVTYAPTCFMFVDTEVFDKMGLMDEKYFVYVDDTDFIYRCVQNNISLWYDHTKTILHKVSSSTGGDDSPFYIYYSNRNKIYFVRKHYDLILKTIAFFHILLTRTINYFRYTKSQKDSLVNAIKDGLKM
jgi:GT2 family glycosyltransferase